MTDGQRQAIAELEAIALESKASLRVEKIISPSGNQKSLSLYFSLRIGPIEHKEGGLRFSEREHFIAMIYETFPFKKPELWVTHKRFAGFPHVQWSRYICLYQASSEWNAPDGMFGFIERLWKWIVNASLKNLDPDDGPLHPPAIYPVSQHCKKVIIKSNAPCKPGVFWAGFGRISKLSRAIEINEWLSFKQLTPDGGYAPTLILPQPLPWEFPTTGQALCDEIEKQGFKKDDLLSILTLASICSANDLPVLVVVGTPMRRSMNGEARIHFSVWEIPEDTADYLRKSLPKTSDTHELELIKGKLSEITFKIFKHSKVNWCRVFEERNEILVRRDIASPVATLGGKNVIIFGCGALGSLIAEMICRAGCSEITLVDFGTVTPGVLVRQNFVRDDLGKLKVDALKERLQLIRPELEIKTIPTDAFLTATDTNIPKQDLVIDTTASNIFHQRLERGWKDLGINDNAYFSLQIDSTASICLGITIPPRHNYGPLTAFRNLKLQLLKDEGTGGVFSRFHRDSMAIKSFQPEPGCSEPTFTGSLADMSALAGMSLNVALKGLFDEGKENVVGFAIRQPAYCSGSIMIKHDMDSVETICTNSYDIHISKHAFKEILACIRKHSRQRDPISETGGLLWGEWDDAARVLWIWDVSDAPPDSEWSKDGFVCGVDGIEQEHVRRMAMTLGSTGFVGMWHTHPSFAPCQSTVDVAGMLQMVVLERNRPRKALMLIVGKEKGDTILGAYIYCRSSKKNFDRISISTEHLKLGRFSWS